MSLRLALQKAAEGQRLNRKEALELLDGPDTTISR